MTRYLSYLAAIFFSASMLIAQSPEPTPQTPNLPTPPPIPPFTPLPLDPAVPPTGTPALPAPTPLPDGTMPLPLPPMPALPPLPDVQQINNELAPPIPPQQPEPLSPSPETSTLQESGRQAVTKEMATTNFYKALDQLIAKQRNPKVPDLTIQDAITAAIQKNPDILVAAQELNTTSGRFISIRSSIIPKVTVKSDYGYTSRELNFVDDLGAQNVNDEQWGVNVEFSQLIYDGGAVVSGIRAAISDEVESYYRLRGVIDQVIFEVKTNFYEVVLNRALIIANQQSVDLLAEQVDHGRAIRVERAAAKAEGREPQFIPLIRAWGGVTIAYRRSLEESPAYRLNHEEISKSLEEGIDYAERLWVHECAYARAGGACASR